MRPIIGLGLLVLALAAAAQPSAVPATLVGTATLAMRRPLAGEPIQGFSSVRLRPDGTYWALADTGHAARPHREDVHVVFHHLYVDWRAGVARLLSARALSDPGRKLGFPIVNEASAARVLSTADVNVDAMAIVGERAWFADDLGPWLIETDLRGRVLSLHRAAAAGKPLGAEQTRRGFGGLAASPDRRFLYAALEGALWDGTRWEALDGREYARLLQFDLRARRWGERELRYGFEANGNAIADLAMIGANLALVLERGAQFRRIYKVLFDGAQARKLAFVDLLPIDLAAAEGIELAGLDYLVLTSGARRELVLLRAPALLAAP